MFGKLIIVAVVAFASVQCVPTKDSTELNLDFLLKNGGALTTTFFKSLNMALDNMKPNFDNILHEMASELQKVIAEGVKETRDTIKAEENKFTHVFSTLTKALDDLKPIQKCGSKLSPDAQKLFHSIQKTAATIYTDITKKYGMEIKRFKDETADAVAEGMKLFDNGVSTVVKCLTPGRKDSKDCMNDAVEDIMAGAIGVGSTLLNVNGQANELYSYLFEEGMKNFAPIFFQSLVDFKELLGTLADCVSSL